MGRFWEVACWLAEVRGGAALASDNTDVLLSSTRMEALGLAAGMSYARNWVGNSYRVSSANLDALPEIALITHPPDGAFCAVYGRAHNVQRPRALMGTTQRTKSNGFLALPVGQKSASSTGGGPSGEFGARNSPRAAGPNHPRS
jgi:hypothetical protein